MNWSGLLRSRRLNALTLVAFAVAILVVVAAPGRFSRGGDSVKTWKITWTNLTSTQPMTPPILVTHKEHLQIWKLGELATAQVAFLAMDPNPGPLANALAGNRDVADVEIGPGPTAPGGTFSQTVTTSGGADRLDFLTMLAKTNDTFSGVSGFHLDGNGTQTVDVYSYDAGTELNNWDPASVPGLGGKFSIKNTAGGPVETGEPIHRTTDADLAGAGPLAWDNTQPVLKLTITRVS